MIQPCSVPLYPPLQIFVIGSTGYFSSPIKIMKFISSSIVLCSLFLFANFSIAQDAVKELELPIVEASSAPPYYTTNYPQPANPKEGQLQIGVTYTLWIPEGLKKVRGIIVHQHGCGSGSCTGSVTAAHDLHWQELARKNNCALLGPSFHQAKEQHCRLWCDPRSGSADVFVDSLKKLAEKSGHPEVATAPWCLWGHSGGGFWSSLMQMLYPKRIAAIWFQSGTAYGYWNADQTPVPEIPAAAMKIPMMANPGIKEKEGKPPTGAWGGSLAMFKDYRSKGAPIAFAPDPASGHETRDSRYLAIPFFDACLDLRLPDQAGAALKELDLSKGWLAESLSENAPVPAKDFKGDATKAVWLPNESVARVWLDFVKTGAVCDTTPPPSPTNVTVDKASGTISWKAEIDFESGLQSFIIERDGKQIGQLPEKLHKRFGRPLFQGMSYGDTPVLPLLKFQFVDENAEKGKDHKYRVTAVNTLGLKSR